MDQVTRIELVRELAKLAELVTADAVAGFVVIAVHHNDTSTELLVPPGTSEGVQKLMLAMDRTHFRMRVTCYLGPKKGAPGAVPGTETEQ